MEVENERLHGLMSDVRRWASIELHLPRDCKKIRNFQVLEYGRVTDKKIQKSIHRNGIKVLPYQTFVSVFVPETNSTAALKTVNNNNGLS